MGATTFRIMLYYHVRISYYCYWSGMGHPLPVSLWLFLGSIPHWDNQCDSWDQQWFTATQKKPARKKATEAGACCHAHLQNTPAENIESEEWDGRNPKWVRHELALSFGIKTPQGVLPLQTVGQRAHKYESAEEWCWSNPWILISSKIQIRFDVVNCSCRYGSFIQTW